MDKGKLKGHAALWVANIIWGLNAPIGKSVLASAANPGGVSPFAMSVYRMVGAALLFWGASLFLLTFVLCLNLIAKRIAKKWKI